MSLYDDVLDKREKILQISKAHGVRRIQIFGSVVRGEDTPESDLDFIVEFLPGKTLLDQVALCSGS